MWFLPEAQSEDSRRDNLTSPLKGDPLGEYTHNNDIIGPATRRGGYTIINNSQINHFQQYTYGDTVTENFF